MGALLRRRYMGGNGGEEPLPQGAIRIEYLKCTGGQYINTGISSFDCTVEVTYLAEGQENNYGNPIIGTSQNARPGHFHVTLYSNKYYYGTGTSSERNSGSANYGTKHTIIYNANNGTLFVDGICTDSGSITQTNNTIWFGRRRSNDVYAKNMEYYEIKMYDKTNEVLLAHFIPCRIEQTGYMYDKVSGTFFGNVGSGSFTLGPDKT